MNTQMNLQRIPVERLKPAKYNPAKTSSPAIRLMKRSAQSA